MANVGGVAQLMETAGTPATQTASVISAGGPPAQSFATVMQQANTDAGVPASPAGQSAPVKVSAPTADAENGDKQESVAQSASTESVPPTKASVTAIKVQSPTSSSTSSSRYTSANLLTDLLSRSGNQGTPVAAQPNASAVNALSSSVSTASANGVPSVVQAAPVAITPAPPAVSESKAPESAGAATVEVAALDVSAAKLPLSPAAVSPVASKASIKPSVTSTRQAGKPDVPVASPSAALVPTLQSGTSAVLAAQAPPVSVPSGAASVQVPAAASTGHAAVSMQPVSASAATPQFAEAGAALTPGTQTLMPSGPATSPASASALGDSQSLAALSGGITAAKAAPISAQDATAWTPAIAASAVLAPQSAASLLAAAPVATASATPAASTPAIRVGPQSTSPLSTVRQTAPLSPLAASPTAASGAAQPALVPSTTAALAAPPTAGQPPQTNVPVAASQKSGSRVSVAANVAPSSASAPQDPAPIQASAAPAEAKDPKDTTHPAAVQAVSAVPTPPLASPALPGDTTVPTTAPTLTAHTPVALTVLSNPGGPALASTTTTATSSAIGGETLPHTTLTSTPTTLEVGVSSGTHGWLKIRAELNATGTVDASLTGTNAVATGRLHNDLPALSSFLQDEKVVLGSLNVAAPNAAASALHATAAATLEPVSAFTRSATEAVGATGTAVASDAGTSGGRAPQQEAQPHTGSPALGNLREDDGLLGAVTAPPVYGDTNDLGNTGALASGSYNGGGSWLNVRV